MLPAVSSEAAHSYGTARAKWEEGVVNGRSVWSESPGLHAGANGKDNRMQLRKEELIPEPLSQYRLRVATHPHDAGIPSRRMLAPFVEYVPAPCTHRPSNHLNRVWMMPCLLAG